MKNTMDLFYQLPNSIFSNLDLSGFYFPESHIEKLRFNLEKELGQYVVSYKAEICNLNTPLESHLCALLKGADLTREQLKLLNIYESLSKRLGVTFVIYQKPFEFIDPYKSSIADLYRKSGKL